MVQNPRRMALFLLSLAWFGAAGAAQTAHDNPYALGLAQIGAAHFEMARMFLERAVVEEPNNARAWFNLGYVRGKLGDEDGKFRAYHRAISIDPKYAEARYGLGVSYVLKGDLCAAMDEANKLRAFDTECARKLMTMIMVILQGSVGSDCAAGSMAPCDESPTSLIRSARPGLLD